MMSGIFPERPESSRGQYKHRDLSPKKLPSQSEKKFPGLSDIIIKKSGDMQKRDVVDRRRPEGLEEDIRVEKVDAINANWAIFGGPEHEPVDPKELRKIQIEIRRNIPDDKISDKAIIRGIVNPDDVEVYRKKGEGAKPIFDRDEIKNGVEIKPEEQRVMIIREPLEEYERKLKNNRSPSPSKRGGRERSPVIITSGRERPRMRGPSPSPSGRRSPEVRHGGSPPPMRAEKDVRSRLGPERRDGSFERARVEDKMRREGRMDRGLDIRDRLGAKMGDRDRDERPDMREMEEMRGFRGQIDRGRMRGRGDVR